MTGETPQAGAQAQGEAAARKPPGIDETVRTLGREGRATLDAALDTGRALRQLASADFALARSSLGRALAWTGVAIVFGASSWLLLMGALIALLQAFGMSWLGAISCAALLSLAVGALAVWRVTVFFDMAGMHATRRQLSRLGLFNEDDGLDEDDAAMAPGKEGA